MQFKSDQMSGLIEVSPQKDITHVDTVHVCVRGYAQNVCELGNIIRDCFPSPTVFSLSQISNYCYSCKQLPMLK